MGGRDPAPVSTRHFGRLTITRAAWLIASGSLPREGLIVVRRCTTPNCANVLHMKIGTRRDRVLPERAAWRGREAEVLAVRIKHPPYEAAMMLGLTTREVGRCILHLAKAAKAPNSAAFLRRERIRAKSSRAISPALLGGSSAE